MAKFARMSDAYAEAASCKARKFILRVHVISSFEFGSRILGRLVLGLGQVGREESRAEPKEAKRASCNFPRERESPSPVFCLENRLSVLREPDSCLRYYCKRAARLSSSIARSTTVSYRFGLTSFGILLTSPCYSLLVSMSNAIKIPV